MWKPPIYNDIIKPSLIQGKPTAGNINNSLLTRSLPTLPKTRSTWGESKEGETWIKTSASVPSRSVVIRNLPNAVSDNDVKALFSQCGDIHMFISKERQNKGIIIVHYYDIRSAEDVKKRFSGRTLHQSKVNVTFLAKDSTMAASLSPSYPYPNRGTVAFENLPPLITEERLLQFCELYGSVRRVSVDEGLAEYFDVREAYDFIDKVNNGETTLSGRKLKAKAAYNSHGKLKSQNQSKNTNIQVDGDGNIPSSNSPIMQQQQQPHVQNRLNHAPTSASSSSSHLSTSQEQQISGLPNHFNNNINLNNEMNLNNNSKNNSGNSVKTNFAKQTFSPPQQTINMRINNTMPRNNDNNNSTPMSLSPPATNTSNGTNVVNKILASMDEQQKLLIDLQGVLIQQMTQTSFNGPNKQVGLGAIQQKMSSCHLFLNQITNLKVQFQNAFNSVINNTNNSPMHLNNNIAYNAAANSMNSSRDKLEQSAGAKPFTPSSYNNSNNTKYFSTSKPLPLSQSHHGNHRSNRDIHSSSSVHDDGHHRHNSHYSSSNNNNNNNIKNNNSRRKRDPRSGKEFHIDVDAILSGSDRRSTIMIQNIPNNYSQTMLLEEINLEFDRTYDFFYLPMDYKNKCNIGYAFINFMDCKHVANFYATFHCREWSRFKSHKICAVKYGRIQGKLGLIQHFKKTNVIKEASIDYRPLLFFSTGPDAGLPEPFSNYLSE
jgi:hypothetical protein